MLGPNLGESATHTLNLDSNRNVYGLFCSFVLTFTGFDMPIGQERPAQCPVAIS